MNIKIHILIDDVLVESVDSADFENIENIDDLIGAASVTAQVAIDTEVRRVAREQEKKQ